MFKGMAWKVRLKDLSNECDLIKYLVTSADDGKIVIPTKLIFYRRRNYGLFMLSAILDE